jgi:hypothetical protein
MQSFIEQIKEKGFKPLLYSIFGYMDDKGYITEWNAIFNDRFEPSDFDYILFSLKENQINGLKYRAKDVIDLFNNLKYLFENKCQENEKTSKCRLFILKDEGKVFLVKFKNFDLIDKLNNLKK